MAPGPPVPPGVTPELAHDMAGGHAQNPLEGMVALHKQMEGALLIRRDATLAHGARALAIVSPAQHMLQRDRVRLLVAQMASPEEVQAHGGLQVLMKEETLPVEGLKLKYTMLAPHLVTPDTERYPQGGMARVAVRSGTGPAVATCANYSIDNPQAITITVVSKAPNGTTQSSTFETTCVGFLQSIDIQATGARNFEDTMFRAIEGGPSIENIRVPGDEPGFFPEINIQIPTRLASRMARPWWHHLHLQWQQACLAGDHAHLHLRWASRSTSREMQKTPCRQHLCAGCSAT
jgi:hypothetical protein